LPLLLGGLGYGKLGLEITGSSPVGVAVLYLLIPLNQKKTLNIINKEAAAKAIAMKIAEIPSTEGKTDTINQAIVGVAYKLIPNARTAAAGLLVGSLKTGNILIKAQDMEKHAKRGMKNARTTAVAVTF